MVRIAIDNRKSEREQEYIRMRCAWLQNRYRYSRETWAMILADLPKDDPDWDCIWGLACGGEERWGSGLTDITH